MNTIWDLENEMAYGNFSAAAPQVADALKVEQAFKILISEVQRLSVAESTISVLQSELALMTSKYEEILEVVRKMGKDYPEVVLAKPHLFAEKETTTTINNYR